MIRYLIPLIAGLLLTACRGGEELAEPLLNGTGDGEIRFEIGFAPSQQGGAAQAGAQTRVATDNKFESAWEEGDAIGLFAVEHGRKPGTSNPVHNVKVVYADGKWTAAAPLYWPSGNAKYDFYAYYPYDGTVTDPAKIAFAAATDQSGATDGNSDFSRSHLLRAKADNEDRGYVRGETVQLAFSQVLSLVEVKVDKSVLGNYPADMLDVRLHGCSTSLVLDLRDGTVSAPSAPEPIRMYPCPVDKGEGIYSYRALVVPGGIAAETVLFRFRYDDKEVLESRPLTEAVTLTAGQAETFDIELPFTVVSVTSEVRIEELLKDADPAAITHLKVLGQMREADVAFIRNKMTALDVLDLGGATLIDTDNALPANAFEWMGLRKFVFPQGLTSIGEAAFAQCLNLTGSLIIPKGVKTIGMNAFLGCSFDGPLVLPEGLESIGSYAFCRCPFTGTLTIPKGVGSIGVGAFTDCRSFTGSLIIPQSVREIGQSAFSECTGFDGTLTLSEGIETIGKGAFFGCSNFRGSLVIPQSLRTLGENAFQNCCGFSGSLVIPKSIGTIDLYAFSGCSGFNGTLTIPEGIEKIAACAFKGCHGFTGPLTIPKSVSWIDNQAFYKCKGFDGPLTISEGVDSLGGSVFYECTGFTGELVIPKSLKKIGGLAFMWCTGFTGSLALPENLIIGNLAFSNCLGINGSLTLSEGIQIGNLAFTETPLSGMLTIPKGVTIGQRAFGGTRFTGSLTLKDIKKVGHSAFYNCITFDGTLTIGEGIEEVEGYAFAFCKNFKELVLTEGLKKIGASAFNGMNGLTSITCLIADPAKVTYGNASFGAMPDLTAVYVPAESLPLYKAHDVWKGYGDKLQAIPQP